MRNRVPQDDYDVPPDDELPDNGTDGDDDEAGDACISDDDLDGDPPTRGERP
jgi:hypothetical protein